MSVVLKTEFEEVLQPLGNNAAEFFMAASLYHARKISFSAAAALANLSFDEFLFRLKEHFDTGFMIDDESVLEDLQTVSDLIVAKGLSGY